MTAKSLLRHPDASSPLEKFTQSGFKTVIGETVIEDDDRVERVILCSGKVYYDLFARRHEAELDKVVIIRIEQLYPFPIDELKQQLARYNNAGTFIWCQEESKNMGAWSFIQPRLTALFDRDFTYAGRDSSASTAVGSLAHHKIELEELLEAAFTL